MPSYISGTANRRFDRDQEPRFWPDRRFFGLIVDRGRVYRGMSRLIADRGQADRGMVNFRDLTAIRPALIAD